MKDIALIIRIINCVALILALAAILAILLDIREDLSGLFTYIQQYEIAE